MDPLVNFREETKTLLVNVLGKHDIHIQPELGDAPKGQGDVAFPCFPLARILKKAPVKIAEELAKSCAEELETSGTGKIAKVGAVNGYLNFHFNDSELARITLQAISDEGEDFGKGEGKQERIILEHTSANPNGPFHVGRARNPIIGDTLARILRFAGYSVTTEYYVNDMGKQVVTLAWGVENLQNEIGKGEAPDTAPNKKSDRAQEKTSSTVSDKASNKEPEKDDHRLVPYYQKASSLMEEDEQILKEINSRLERYEKGDKKIGQTVQKYCSLVLEGMKTTLSQINITIDDYIHESGFVYNGDVQNIVSILNRSPHSEGQEGARYLELEEFGIQGRNTKFFYTRTDGTSLYTTRDLAYHLDKFARGDRLINVLGEDHKLQAQQLAIALGELGEKRRPEPIFYAFVSLPGGKMSTRKGRVVYLDNLIDDAIELAYNEVEKRRPELTEEEKQRIARLVGIGAIRYNIIRVQMEKSIVFKWEEALNFEGDSAPFIQYTHARACSILRKLGKEKDMSAVRAANVHNVPNIDNALNILKDPHEIALIRALASFPGMVQECANGLKLHPMASYIRNTAQLFNQFYRECPVLTASEEERKARSLLVDSFRTVISCGLGLLGIEAPDYM